MRVHEHPVDRAQRLVTLAYELYDRYGQGHRDVNLLGPEGRAVRAAHLASDLQFQLRAAQDRLRRVYADLGLPESKKYPQTYLGPNPFGRAPIR